MVWQEQSKHRLGKATLARCRQVAQNLHLAAGSHSKATAALQLVRRHLGCEMTVARRLDEVLSVEAGSILARGHEAADEGMAVVSDMINGFLQMEAARAEDLSNQPSTTAVELSFNARNLGILLLPTLLECTLAGITKCWDCDWGLLGRQLQPLHDLVLKKPLLDHAAMALLQLIWLRAPMLLPGEADEKGKGRPQGWVPQGLPMAKCIYGLACLSQEIHDTLVVEGMEQANAQEIQLMAHVRREVLQHLGQSGRWQPEHGKLESGQVVPETPPVSKKRPSTNRQSSPKKRRTANQQIVPVGAQEIESFMAALLDKFGCEPLVGSFMERVEKAMAAMTLAATKGFTKEAKEASDAALAAEKIADVMMNFQILLGFGKEAKQAIVDQLPQLVRHLLETSSWPDCWRHALCDMLELVIHQKLARESSASLWDQVGQKWLEHANASRLTAVGSLATVLAGVLTQMPDAKAAESLKCMENLRYSAASCLICFQKADPQKTLDGKLAFSDMSSAEEDEAPRSSRLRHSDELHLDASDSSEEIGSEDSCSQSEGEGGTDLESFEDDAAEFNDCGFLLADSPRKRQRFTSGAGASSSDQPTSSMRHRSNLVPDWKERVKEILKKLPAGPEKSDKLGADSGGNDLSSDKAVRTDEDLQPDKDLPPDAVKVDAKCDLQLQAVNEISVQC
ncbi:unnamed protein product [Symbiodinium sp. CCMP2592]|nr:unnamed protein product [Symbiodinium sp. CCMP2592]